MAASARRHNFGRGALTGRGPVAVKASRADAQSLAVSSGLRS